MSIQFWDFPTLTPGYKFSYTLSFFASVIEMTINLDELNSMTHLAYLEPDPDEQAVLAAEISAIMDFVQQLAKVDTRGVMPLLHPMDLHQRMRQDEISAEEDCLAQLESLAPHFEDNLYLVPNVMESGE